MANKNKFFGRADDPRPGSGFCVENPETGEKLWLTPEEKSLAYTKARAMSLLGYSQQEIAKEVFVEIMRLRKAKRWFTT